MRETPHPLYDAAAHHNYEPFDVGFDVGLTPTGLNIRHDPDLHAVVLRVEGPDLELVLSPETAVNVIFKLVGAVERLDPELVT